MLHKNESVFGETKFHLQLNRAIRRRTICNQNTKEMKKMDLKMGELGHLDLIRGACREKLCQWEMS